MRQNSATQIRFLTLYICNNSNEGWHHLEEKIHFPDAQNPFGDIPDILDSVSSVQFLNTLEALFFDISFTAGTTKMIKY